MQPAQPNDTARMYNRVPQVTLIFWIIKVLSTTVGETGADYLAVNAGFGTLVTDLLTGALLALALYLQMRSRRFVPWKYWLTVVLLSIAGTQITDFLTDRLGVSLYVTTVAFAVLLLAVFAAWYRCEGSLSIRTIVTRRREWFYWAVILLTFALGTAGGDLATEALGLGFRVGAVVFAALLAATFVARRLGANPVLTFWLAYILTRPLGASLGDLLSQSTEYGGLGFGTIHTSAAFLGLIAALVTLVSRAPAPRAA